MGFEILSEKTKVDFVKTTKQTSMFGRKGKPNTLILVIRKIYAMYRTWKYVMERWYMLADVTFLLVDIGINIVDFTKTIIGNIEVVTKDELNTFFIVIRNV